MLQNQMLFLSFLKVESLGSWGKKNPATDLGPAEEGTDHLLGHTEKAVQTMQRKNERGEISTVNKFTEHSTNPGHVFMYGPHSSGPNENF